MSVLPRAQAIRVFLVFAVAYFFSTLIRAITATLSPILTQEFALNARDLGLLAGGYFLGFAATQLPLGAWLDRFGPKRVLLGFLAVAVAGCLAFAVARGFTSLLAARVLCGIGVSACLMAPLTGYRRWLDGRGQLRANSWMLMTGSLGMVAATLPVQWLVPVVGWRALFMGLAGCVLAVMALIAWVVPIWWGLGVTGTASELPACAQTSVAGGVAGGYAEVWRHPFFRRMAPIGFFCYGGLLAMQTLWVVPWMTRVMGYSAMQAATGFFWINVCMLATFWAWGMVNPVMVRRGVSAERQIALGMPLSFFLLAIIIIANNWLETWAIATFSFYFMACSVVSLSQPAVGLAFPQALAGRALSAYNLVLFAGIFTVQWGIGLLIDAFQGLGWGEVAAYRAAFAVFLACCVASYLYFLQSGRDNQPAP
jgi:MFS family permease